MKFVTLIALGTLVFLSSEGRAIDDESYNNSQGSCARTLPYERDEPTDTPSLGSQSVPLSSLFYVLIQNGRPGGFSPHRDHLSDLMRTTPRLGNSKLKCTRGTSFSYKPPKDDGSDFSNSDLEPLGSQD